MAEYIMKFNIPEEINEFKLAEQGAESHIALHEFSEYLRQLYKWDESISEDNVKFLEIIRERFFQIVNDCGLTL